MSTYTVLKNRHQQEVNAFPMAFAFNQRQFEEGMAKLGLGPDDTDKVYKIGDTGGFYRRSDAARFRELFDRHEREHQEATDGDTTGEGYIYEMFLYELANHEYTYTGDLTSTLEALDLTPEDFEKSAPLRNGLRKAKEELWRQEEAF